MIFVILFSIFLNWDSLHTRQLQGIKLQAKEEQDGKHIGKVFRKKQNLLGLHIKIFSLG